MQHILDLDYSDWLTYFQEKDFPRYRAEQIFKWLHQKNILNPDLMTDVPDNVRKLVKEEFLLVENNLISEIHSEVDDTAKYLYEFSSKQIESVWLPYATRQSVCISVQSGCTMDCVFCATGKMKFMGNLSCGEILSQVYLMQQANNKRVTNVVFMGMGEPFHNYDNVIKAATILGAEKGLNLSRRKITISTSGVLPGIERFINEKQPFRLALSLHSVFPEKRFKLMPIEKKYPLADIISFLYKNRDQLDKGQLMLEYIMIDDFNIGSDDADALAELARQLQAKINLIPLNSKDDHDRYRRPPEEKIHQFWLKLNQSKVLAVNRRSPGKDIAGACGMLAAQSSG